MKRVILLGFFVSLAYLVFGQATNESENLFKYFTPPGVKYLFKNFYIDETEVANIHWLEYLYYISKESGGAQSQTYLDAIPDTSCYQNEILKRNGLFYNDKDSIGYFSFEKYRYYPVVGVSNKQAINFCIWRSKIVNEGIKNGTIKVPKKLKDYEIEVEYRLPTLQEWEHAALGGLDFQKYPHGQIRPTTSKGSRIKISSSKYCKECLDDNKVNYDLKEYINRVEFRVFDEFYFDINDISFNCYKDSLLFYPTYIFSYPANGYGLYNMIGNVSEMTSTEGISKGGAFRNKLSNFSVKTNFNYILPAKWLGFRCYCVVYLKRKSH